MLKNPYTGELDVTELNALRDDQFALIEKNAGRYFPVNSREETQNSIEDFVGSLEDLSKEARVKTAYYLKQAAAYFGIDENEVVNQYAEPQDTNFVFYNVPEPTIQKKASHSVFALDGKYPIDSPDLIKQASVYFDKHYRSFLPREQHEFAKNVQKAAGMMGVETSGTIQKMASTTFDQNVFWELKARENVALNEHKHYYQKLATIVGKTSSQEFAHALYETDKRCGLTEGYNKLYKHPAEAVVGIPKVAAKHSDWTTTVSGKSYTKENLDKALSNDQVIKMFGKSMIDQMKKDPAVFDSLPVDHKETILSHG